MSSWSARRSNSRQVASSEPVANAFPLGKNCGGIWTPFSLVWKLHALQRLFLSTQLSVWISTVASQNEAGTLTQMALMSDSWPVKVCLHMPSRTSQSLAEASQAPDTNSLVSGARDRLITSPVWPANVVVCWPVSMSQRALRDRSQCFKTHIHTLKSKCQWKWTATFLRAGKSDHVYIYKKKG